MPVLYTIEGVVSRLRETMSLVYAGYIFLDGIFSSFFDLIPSLRQLATAFKSLSFSARFFAVRISCPRYLPLK